MDLCFKCLPQGRYLLYSLRVVVSTISSINYFVRLKEKTHHTVLAFFCVCWGRSTLLSINYDIFKNQNFEKKKKNLQYQRV